MVGLYDWRFPWLELGSGSVGSLVVVVGLMLRHEGSGYSREDWREMLVVCGAREGARRVKRRNHGDVGDQRRKAEPRRPAHHPMDPWQACPAIPITPKKVDAYKSPHGPATEAISYPVSVHRDSRKPRPMRRN